MKLRLLTTLSALSTAALVVLAALWLESIWVERVVSLTISHRFSVGVNEIGIWSLSGHIGFGYLNTFADLPTGLTHRTQSNPDPFTFFYFEFWHEESVFAPGNVFQWRGVVPHWILMLPAMTLPAIWLKSNINRRRRRKHGLCAACGYDLRESPTRCPECGTKY